MCGNGGADSHKCTRCFQFADGKIFIRQEGWKWRVGRGGVRHCSSWPAKLGAASSTLAPPPHPPPPLTLPIIPNVSIFFSSQAPERRAESHSGGSSHILTPHCSPSQICSPCSPAITSSPSKTSRHITLIYSSLCYSQVAGLPTQPSKCLLVLPPLVQRWPCLYHQDALLLL